MSLKAALLNSAQVIPRQGVETFLRLFILFLIRSAQVIPRQGVETLSLFSSSVSSNLSTGDSPTGGGN